MALRTENIKINGIDIEIKETSFGAQLRLQSLDSISFEDVYKNCMSKEDYEKIGTFDNLSKEEGKLIINAYEKVNRKTTPSEQEGMGQ